MDVESKTPCRVDSKFGRIVVVVLFFTLIAVTLFFTPLPNAPEESCDRPCHELEWPRICRFKFVLESHLASAKKCHGEEHCSSDEFQGLNQELLTVNQQIPGPQIHVCIHDILLINVINRVPHRQTSIHWRGISHRKNPLMDGVSMISQCPIASFTTFQYKFRASDPGTHTWHLHNDNDKFNFAQGLLVVRQSVREEPQHDFYDFDNSSHAIVLRSISNKNTATILVNGKSSSFQMDEGVRFSVTHGSRFRFRVAHAGGPVNCPITFSIEEHPILVVSLDGNPIQPVNTTRVIFARGERLDFVVNANRPPKLYKILFEFDSCNIQTRSSASIVYEDVSKTKSLPLSKSSHEERHFPMVQSFSTIYSESCNGETVCLENLKSMAKVPQAIFKSDNPQVHYLLYGRHKRSIGQLPGVFEVGHINNITFLPPSSPLASQTSDVSAEDLCIDEKAVKCTEDGGCQCTYLIKVELDKVVDLILIDENDFSSEDHIFHLHGHKFYVLGRQSSINKLSPNSGHTLQFDNQVLKDTITVPRNGSAVIRFLADNAGYWLLEEDGNELVGMKLIFHVTGHSYEVPEKFPKCGNWIGPKYFLA